MTGETGTLVSLSIGSGCHVVHTACHTECTLERHVLIEFVLVVDTQVGLAQSRVADDTFVVKIATSHVVVGLVVTTVY